MRLHGDVHAGRFCAGRDGSDARQERGPHDGDELPRLRHRHHRLLGGRFRPADGRRWRGRLARQRRDPVVPVHRDGGRARARSFRHARFLSRARGVHERGRHSVPLSTGVHGHRGHHPDRRDGRTLALHFVRDLLAAHRDHHLPDLRQLGLGRRLVVGARQGVRARPRARRFRRQLRRAHDRGRDRVRRRESARPARRQVRPPRRGQPDPGPQPGHGGAGHVHPRVRLVRFQRRLHARGQRPAHRDHRGQHHDGLRGGRRHGATSGPGTSSARRTSR